MFMDVKFVRRVEGGYSASFKDYTSADWKPACAVVKTAGGWTTVPMLGDEPIKPQKTREKAVKEILAQRWTRYAEALEAEVTQDDYFRNYNRGERSRRMSGDLAQRIFTILVEECGALSQDEDYFVTMMSREMASDRDEAYRSHEHRFGGWLGFGGKFWNERNRFRVSAYSEDTNPRTRLMMARANKRLQDLYRETWPFTP